MAFKFRHVVVSVDHYIPEFSFWYVKSLLKPSKQKILDSLIRLVYFSRLPHPYIIFTPISIVVFVVVCLFCVFSCFSRVCVVLSVLSCFFF